MIVTGKVPPVPVKSFQKVTLVANGVVPDEGTILANTPFGRPSANMLTFSPSAAVDVTVSGNASVDVEFLVRSASRTPAIVNLAVDSGSSSPFLQDKASRLINRKEKYFIDITMQYLQRYQATI